MDSSDTDVWVSAGPHHLDVVVVGPDSRIIQSVESELRETAEASGAVVENENPRDVPTGDRHYMGFSAGDEPGHLETLRSVLERAATAHPWVATVRVGHGWPQK